MNYWWFHKWKSLKPRIMYFIRRVIWKPLNTLQLRQKNWSSKLFSSFFPSVSLSASFSLYFYLCLCLFSSPTLLHSFPPIRRRCSTKQQEVGLGRGFMIRFFFSSVFFLFLLFLFSPSLSLWAISLVKRKKKG